MQSPKCGLGKIPIPTPDTEHEHSFHDRGAQQRAWMRLDEVFEKEFYKELRESREHVERVWKSAREPILQCITQRSLTEIPRLTTTQQKILTNLSEQQVQNLLDQLRDTMLRKDSKSSLS